MIALGCAASLWGLAALINHKRIRPPTCTTPSENRKPDLEQLKPHASYLRYAGLALALWFITVEAGAELWYRSVESRPAPAPKWSVMFPTNNPTFRIVPISADTQYLLRFDEGKQGAWLDSDGTRWQAFYYDWNPGRVAGYLAKRHTPEICLPASGARLVSGPKLTVMRVKNVTLPMRSYTFAAELDPIYVFQCRWEAGMGANAYVEQEASRFNLIRGIWAGRGNRGQKVLEVVISRANSPEQAAAAFSRELENLVVVETH